MNIDTEVQKLKNEIARDNIVTDSFKNEYAKKLLSNNGMHLNSLLNQEEKCKTKDNIFTKILSFFKK